MQDIKKVINENHTEAYDLIKSVGGRIDFVANISEDDWHGNPNKHSLPWVVVVVGCDEGLIDAAVLSVKCGEDGNIEFLAFDVEIGECYGWILHTTCHGNTENEVYMFIEEWINGHKK